VDRAALEKTTLPVAPTAGALVAQAVPRTTDDETNVALPPTGLVSVTVEASLGPLFTIVTL
jgi:hypothetical protein